MKIKKLKTSIYYFEGHGRITMRREYLGSDDYIWQLFLDNELVSDFPVFDRRSDIVEEIYQVGLRNIYKEE